MHQTTDELTRGNGFEQSRILCIGPAGEKRVRFAAVMNDRNRAYGRSGPGAVWGFKQLKAVRVSGKMKIEIKDQERYQSGLDQARYLMKAAPVTKRLLKELGPMARIRIIGSVAAILFEELQAGQPLGRFGHRTSARLELWLFGCALCRCIVRL